jgi:hypothetical protein
MRSSEIKIDGGFGIAITSMCSNGRIHDLLYLRSGITRNPKKSEGENA